MNPCGCAREPVDRQVLEQTGFIGREPLQPAQCQPLRKKLLTFVFEDPAVDAWGGESIVVGDQPVGETSFVGWGWASGRCVALGFVRRAAANATHQGTAVAIDLWGDAVAARARDCWVPPAA